MYDFEHFPERRNTESVKWGVYPQDVLPMWVADMDFVSPQPVIDALMKRVEHGVFGYPMVTRELKNVVVQRMLDRYHWQVDASELIFVPGVVSGFNLICQAFAGSQDSILMNTPVYPPFLDAPVHAGAERIEVPMLQESDGKFLVDFDLFERKIQPNTRVFMLCNPHNPVGRAFTRAELEKMADICLRHHVLICSDEIHSDLIFSGHTHTPVASINEEISQETVTLIAPSKTFNIAGLECSVIICKNEEYRKKIEKARRGILGGVNVLGLTAGLAAYQYGDPWLKELLVVLEANRDLMVNFIKEKMPEIKVFSPEATYLAWFDCRSLNLPEDPYQFFLDRAKVALNKGRDFGIQGEKFLRFNFGCPQTMVIEALERMEKALHQR